MVYLVRHGETRWNTQGRVQGRKDISLNLKGVKQAMDRRGLFTDHHFTRVLVSPLKRADATAKILTKDAKVDSYETDERLIEYDFGSRDGLKIWEEDENLPHDEEDVDLFRKRIIEVLADAAMTKGNVMLVSHGAVIGTLLRMLLPPEYAQANIPLGNCSVAAVDGEIDSEGRLALTLLGLNMSDEDVSELLKAND